MVWYWKWVVARSNQEKQNDLTARVFRLKLVQLMAWIKKSEIFGSVQCDMYTIEWQKRGLPHSHILIWLSNKLQPNQIDSIISAELPDPSQNRELFDIVKATMVHGPCGRLNSSCPCMKDNKCIHKFPRPYLLETQTGDDEYPSYRRRKPGDGGFIAQFWDYEVNNQWIVPYNPFTVQNLQCPH